MIIRESSLLFLRHPVAYITRSIKFKCSLSNAKNVSTDQLMLYLVKLGESHQRKLSCTSLPQNVSPSFCMVLKSVHLRRPKCTHSTSYSFPDEVV